MEKGTERPTKNVEEKSKRNTVTVSNTKKEQKQQVDATFDSIMNADVVEEKTKPVGSIGSIGSEFVSGSGSNPSADLWGSPSGSLNGSPGTSPGVMGMSGLNAFMGAFASPGSTIGSGGVGASLFGSTSGSGGWPTEGQSPSLGLNGNSNGGNTGVSPSSLRFDSNVDGFGLEDSSLHDPFAPSFVLGNGNGNGNGNRSKKMKMDMNMNMNTGMMVGTDQMPSGLKRQSNMPFVSGLAKGGQTTTVTETNQQNGQVEGEQKSWLAIAQKDMETAKQEGKVKTKVSNSSQGYFGDKWNGGGEEEWSLGNGNLFVRGGHKTTLGPARSYQKGVSWENGRGNGKAMGM
eukprot:TRINITY_DN5279_c0_g1_i1.p1 TRINITY_DN5279_c0_g1~~TRINITY_DN5279_c0_g1_i1.p1  ORF type:complete len:345 (-),score=120.45 TRINITY_DN5279_c0_g1_i1:514-1548(-)